MARDLEDPPPRFIADAMLGRLARYLRFLGYDTTYDVALDDAELVARAAAERRILLTRDRRLVSERRPPDAVLIDGDDVLDQLRQTVSACSLTRREPALERCSRCNRTLEPARPDLVRDRVPARVRETAVAFGWCRGCDRVYWDGSHMRRLRERLAGLWQASG